MGGQPSSIPCSFHSRLGVLAQHGRALAQWRVRSVPELTSAIKDYIALHNKNPKPIAWTAKSHDVLAKVILANSRLSSKQNEALR